MGRCKCKERPCLERSARLRLFSRHKVFCLHSKGFFSIEDYTPELRTGASRSGSVWIALRNPNPRCILGAVDPDAA